MPRPTVAKIDLNAMQHNLRLMKKLAGQAQVWAVVKANAYGHGLERAMRGFADADGMALLELHAAIELRRWGWYKPILLLEGFFEPADLDLIFDAHLDFVVHCNEQIDMLERCKYQGEYDVHIKMNTGMNRLGFRPENFRAACLRLRAIGGVRKIIFMTHMANAEFVAHPRLGVAVQMENFVHGMGALEGKVSVSNSAITLYHPNLKADFIRSGILLYGASPGGNAEIVRDFVPCMTLSSEIIAIQHIKQGEVIGYGSRSVSKKNMKIGIVACGYADGYPRQAPDGTPVYVDGKFVPLIGCVSMDMLTVDLTDLSEVGYKSQVELWGKNLSIDLVARFANTIGYELMCSLASRVHTVEVSPNY